VLDFQKSRSQPDFPSASGKPPRSMSSQPTSSGSSVKRRSSDRSNRYGKLRWRCCWTVSNDVIDLAVSTAQPMFRIFYQLLRYVPLLLGAISSKV